LRSHGNNHINQQTPDHMKTKFIVRSICLCAALFGSSLSPAWAANVIKLDTTSMAATTANWSAVPAATDIGEFDGTASAASLAGLTLGGADLPLGGLLFDGTLQGPATVAAGNNLILGASGIDMSAANQSVTLSCIMSLASAQYWNVVSPQKLTVGGVVAITNLLTLNGTGAVALNVANTGTGGLTISNGFVTFGNAAAGGTGMLTLGGGTLAINGLTISDAINVTGTALLTNGLSASTFSGTWTGAGTLNVIEGTNSTITFSAAGGLSAFTGTIKMSDSQPANGFFRFSGTASGSTAATFDLGNGFAIMHTRNGQPVNLGALKGGVNSTIEGARSTTGANTTYSVGGNNTSTTFAGLITNGTVAGGTLSLTKVGTGTLTLTGTNNADATGPTEVSAGTLQIGDGNADGSLTSGNTIIDAAGTLLFDRPDNYTMNTSIANSGALTIIGGGTNTYNNGSGAYSGTGSINVLNGGFVLASPVTALGLVNVAAA
jgi:autotransporter-associated beta strand protein